MAPGNVSRDAKKGLKNWWDRQRGKFYQRLEEAPLDSSDINETDDARNKAIDEGKKIFQNVFLGIIKAPLGTGKDGVKGADTQRQAARLYLCSRKCKTDPILRVVLRSCATHLQIKSSVQVGTSVIETSLAVALGLVDPTGLGKKASQKSAGRLAGKLKKHNPESVAKAIHLRARCMLLETEADREEDPETKQKLKLLVEKMLAKIERGKTDISEDVLNDLTEDPYSEEAFVKGIHSDWRSDYTELDDNDNDNDDRQYAVKAGKILRVNETLLRAEDGWESIKRALAFC
jgi:hypothetical protein